MNKALQFLLVFFLLASSAGAQTGITWNMSMNIISASGNGHPRIALDRSGNPLILWSNTTDAMFARWDGTAFTTPVSLNPNNINVAGAAWMGPDIATHGDTVYVVFKQSPEAIDTCHIFCVHSYDGGVTFSTPVQVDAIADSLSRFPVVTTDDIGNPIIGFMKFNSQYLDSRWVVTKSTDFGFSFSVDTKASGWSSGTSVICDCCPGAIASSGNTVAMVYRDNNNNVRDMWSGISTDGGNSFSYGMPIDQHNWSVFVCPATGGDAAIIGDTLYSVFMNGSGGTNLSYMTATSISEMTGSQGVELTDPIAGLTLQSYPRLATDGTAMAVVWKQLVNGNDQCMLRFTNDIANGLPMAYDTVDLDHIVNADVAIQNGTVYVIWQDDNTLSIKLRTGTFNSTTSVNESVSKDLFSVYPNPASADIHIVNVETADEIKITNLVGRTIFCSKSDAKKISINLKEPGIYFVTVSGKQQSQTKMVTVLK
ncbi:hypothetical protein BH11BAC1_BH11BAC1_28230 [soil metagenome]